MIIFTNGINDERQSENGSVDQPHFRKEDKKLINTSVNNLVFNFD